MTLKFKYGSDIQHKLYWNIPNLEESVGNPSYYPWNLRFKSMHSNRYLDMDMTNVAVQSNDRYSVATWISFAAPRPNDQHINGIYEAELYSEKLGLSYKQIVKIITSPGGTTGTKPYISDNEDREAIVYYKPEY